MKANRFTEEQIVRALKEVEINGSGMRYAKGTFKVPSPIIIQPMAKKKRKLTESAKVIF